MDDTRVKQVMTYQSGIFYFSKLFNSEQIAKSALVVREFAKSIQLPILPRYASKLQAEIIMRSIFGTAAIEGNPLSENDVNEILISEETNVSKNNAKIEIENLKLAYQKLSEIEMNWAPNSGMEITEDFVRETHMIVTQNVDDEDNVPGVYRDRRVTVGNHSHGGVYTPPISSKDVKKLMGEFIEWINDSSMLQLDPIIRASLFHFHFGLIHPFGNGNGRTARLIEAAILRNGGFKYAPEMLSNFYYLNMDAYFKVFRATEIDENNDVTSFVSFTLEGLIASFKDIRDRIVYYIRVLSLKDYYYSEYKRKSINQRQFNLLRSIIGSGKSFIFKKNDLFQHPHMKPIYQDFTTKTAGRDLKRLIKLKFLRETDEKEYKLNYFLLD